MQRAQCAVMLSFCLAASTAVAWTSGGGTIPTPGSLTGLTPSLPIVAQSGQTISRVKVSNPNGPCIIVNGVSNVRITASEIGPCGDGSSPETPGVLIAGGANNIRVDHNVISNAASGVVAADTTGNIRIDYNFIHSVRGPMWAGQAVQFARVQGAGNKAMCNIAQNASGDNTEDGISLYRSHGTAASPIEIAYNRVTGGHSRSGSGINLGDDGGSYINVHDNTVVNVNNVGLAVSAGTNIVLANNRIYNNYEYSSYGITLNNWYASTSQCSAITMSGNRVWSFDRVWTQPPREQHYGNRTDGSAQACEVTLSNNVLGDTSLTAAIFDQPYAQCTDPIPGGATPASPPPPPPPSPAPPPAPTGDTTAPKIAITTPAPGARVGRFTQAIAATASDNVGVVKVMFYVGGNLLTTDTSAPYSTSFSTFGIARGTHKITAVAYDAAGNTATAEVNVTK